MPQGYFGSRPVISQRELKELAEIVSDSKETNWRAIASAFIVTFVLEAVTGGVWGVFGLFLFLSGSEGAVKAVLSPTGYVVGFVVSLVPVVIGTLFLLRSVSHEQKQHCLLLGIFLVSVSLGLGLATHKLDFAWHDIFYYLAIVPTAMITNHFSNSERGRE